MSEFLEIVGKVLSVLGTLATTAVSGIKLYRALIKLKSDECHDSTDDVDRRSVRGRERPTRPAGVPWFVWALAAALAVLFLGLVLLVVGVRPGKVRPHEVVEKPDARKVQQARERLQFRDGVPIPVRDLYRGMWDLMYSGIIQNEYGGKVNRAGCGPATTSSRLPHARGGEPIEQRRISDRHAPSPRTWG